MGIAKSQVQEAVAYLEQRFGYPTMTREEAETAKLASNDYKYWTAKDFLQPEATLDSLAAKLGISRAAVASRINWIIIRTRSVRSAERIIECPECHAKFKPFSSPTPPHLPAARQTRSP